MNKWVYLGLTFLDISKIAMYEYLSNGMTTWNQIVETRKNYAKRI